jgi:hypothetical protein
MTQLQAAYETIDKLRKKLEAHHQPYTSTQGEALLDLAITQLQNLTALVMDMERDLRRCERYAVPLKYRSGEEDDGEEG